MSLTSLPVSAQKLLDPALLKSILGELQGISIDVVDGAAAGTAMTIAGIKPNDTIVAAVKLMDTWAAPTDDKANITIQPVRASGTITMGGNPVAGETFVVNGNTYTWRAAPTKLNEVKITTGDNNAMAASVAAAINAYETRYESQLNGDSYRKAGVTASANLAVVTVTATTDGAGNAVTLTGTATVLVATGSGTLAPYLTCATVVSDNTFVLTKLDGTTVTFTAKAEPTGDVQFDVKGSNSAQATEIARVVNAYEAKYGTLGVSASANAAVATFTRVGAAQGNQITLTEASTNVTVSGSGTLTGGSNTGSIKSTTNLSAATLIVFWFNKP